VAGLGFVATLGLINVDGFIASRNIARLQASGELDVVYLAQLTGDALPTQAGSLSEASPPELLAHLACQRALRADQRTDPDWQSWNWGRMQAAKALDQIRDRLQRYAVDQEDTAWIVAGPGVDPTPCLGQWLD
jgi:hypothetical protein